MRNQITEIDRHKLEIIATSLSRQSSFHKSNITAYFKVMIDAAREEFTEDSPETLNFFLAECFEDALHNNN